MDSFWPSMALGIMSLMLRTSSVMRRDSSSLLLVADFRDPMTVSTSKRAASRRSVRAWSAVFSASVSEASWSRSVKAFSNEASMEALSCSS